MRLSRPKVWDVRFLRFSIRLLHVPILHMFKKIPIILVSVKKMHIPPILTVNTDGKNSLVRDYILPTLATMGLMFGLLGIITFTDPKEPGTVDARRPPPLCVEKLRPSWAKKARLTAGEMENKLDPSCT